MESSAQVAPPAPEPALDPRRWKALALLCGAFFMVLLDATIVLVALPSIQADIGFSEQGLQWVLSAYALTFGGLLLLGGRAADLLGRRRLFMTRSPVVHGRVAPLRARLVAGRAPCGPRGPGRRRRDHDPTALSIISTTFPEGAERNKALGIWGGLGGIGAAAAWLIGGPLVDGPGWEWIFFINIPLGLAALALSPVLLRESRDALTRRSYDPAGALTITGCARPARLRARRGAGRRLGRCPRRSSSSPASAVLLAAFALIESRHRAPLVPLRFLRSRTIVGANAVMLLVGTVAVGMPFVLTLYAQQVLGYSAVEFGVGSVVLARCGHGRRDRRSGRGAEDRLPAGRRDGHGAHGRGVAPAHAGLGWRELLRRHLLRAARRRSRDRPRVRHRHGGGARGRRRARVRARLGPQQHRPPDRRSARRRHRHDGCRLPLRGLPGGERWREPARQC